MTDLSVSVENARISLGMTQQALAERLGISQAHYSKVANEAVEHSSALAERMTAWLEGVGTEPLTFKEQRARALARSIRKQSRELAALLASPKSAGAVGRVKRAQGKPDQAS